MLKLIPREIVKSQQVAKRKVKQVLKKFISVVQKKKAHEDKFHQQILEKTLLKFYRYIKKLENFTLAEISELIESLQRSTLILQKKQLRFLKEKINQQKKRK